LVAGFIDKKELVLSVNQIVDFAKDLIWLKIVLDNSQYR
jgi:hypothetical protein